MWDFKHLNMSAASQEYKNLFTSHLDKEQASFNFMAAVTICSDFRAQTEIFKFFLTGALVDSNAQGYLEAFR